MVKTATRLWCFPLRDARLESAEGKVISPSDADLVKQITGVSSVLSSSEMTEEKIRSLLGGAGAVIFTPFAPAEGNGQSRDELRGAIAAIEADPWDGRPSRETHFRKLLQARFPGAEMRNLTPILDELRSVKSPREIALIRRALQLAGRGLIEAMKSSRPGVFEYQLDAAARYVFLSGGARLEGYRSITAAGTANIWNMHYYRNTAELKAGDLVLMDFAPEVGCYTSDIGADVAGERQIQPGSGRDPPVRSRVPQRDHETASPGSNASARFATRQRPRWRTCFGGRGSRNRFTRPLPTGWWIPAAESFRIRWEWPCTTMVRMPAAF